MLITISLPNDFGHEHSMEAAIAACYGGDQEAAAEDCGERIAEILADVARASGLNYVRATDFGATWRGTAHQVDSCMQALPEWAFTDVQESCRETP